MTLGKLLTGDGARDGVAHEKDAQLDTLALDERAGETQGVKGALAAIRLIVDDDEGPHLATPDVSSCRRGPALPLRVPPFAR
jgi:hypothetical protein